MARSAVEPFEVTCSCGKVRFDVCGDPIISAVCYCNDCQEGGARLQALEEAPPVLETDGGAAYVTLRDDHWRCVSGENLLEGIRLGPKAPTTRFYASCCNSGMFLKFKYGHWVSTYAQRYLPQRRPDMEMRTNLRRRRSPDPLPADIPGYRAYPTRLFWRLLMSRIAMAIGR